MARKTKEIIQALNDFLVLFDSGSFDAKISFEADVFEPPKNIIWLEQSTLFKIPQKLGAFHAAGNYREEGTYKVNVCRALGSGAIESSDIADKLTSYFKRGIILDSAGAAVNILSSFRLTPFKDNQWYKIPVIIKFYIYSEYIG